MVAQLEWGDFQVQQSGSRITNPAGFYVSLVSGNVNPPPGFETASQRKAREDEARRLEEVRQAENEWETEYEWYCDREVKRYIAALDPDEVASVREAKRREYEQKYQNPQMVDSFAEYDAKRELGKRAPLMTLEEFKASRANQPDLFLKPVSEYLPDGEAMATEPEVLPVETKTDGLRGDGAAVPVQPHEAKEEIVEPTLRQEPEPAVHEPVVELVSQPPEFGESASDDSIEPQIM